MELAVQTDHSENERNLDIWILPENRKKEQKLWNRMVMMIPVGVGAFGTPTPKPVKKKREIGSQRKNRDNSVHRTVKMG